MTAPGASWSAASTERIPLRPALPGAAPGASWSAASTERIPLRLALPGATAVIYLSETAAERAVHHKLAVLEAEVARLAEQLEARRRPLVSRDTLLIGVGLGLLGVAAYLGTMLWTLAAG